MSLTLYAHPFSSYCQKVLVALYENDVPFEYRMIEDPSAMAEAARKLDLAYGWLEQRLEGRTWAAGDTMSMADCAAAPSLFYADWVHPIAEDFPKLRAYRSRLLAWPSFARAVDEARPYRHYFPLGAPDRD
jgi:glutathione S-transferase